jgi:hypothetical protein
MNVLVIGAPDPVRERLRALAAAASSRIDLVGDDGPQVPDWVLTATSAQRAAAIATYKLPPYRVMEVAALLSEAELQQSADFIRAGFAKMAAIGAPQSVISPAGTALTRLVVRRLQRAAERAVAIGVAAPADFRTTEATPWPPTAAAWTTGPESLLEAQVAPRVIVGAELDEKLQDIARKRARRFARHQVRWESVATDGSR